MRLRVLLKEYPLPLYLAALYACILYALGLFVSAPVQSCLHGRGVCMYVCMYVCLCVCVHVHFCVCVCV